MMQDMPLFRLDDSESPKEVLELEEIREWPSLIQREARKLRALPYLRKWMVERKRVVKKSKEDPRWTDPGFEEWMVSEVTEMSRKAWIENDKIWKVTRGGQTVEVLDIAERLHEVLLICHEGMGYRQLGTVYDYFCRRFWVPCAAKLVRRHIWACKVCKSFAAKSVRTMGGATGYSPSAKDVFMHWSIDFAGPFPRDAETGCQYVIVAVDCVTKWAEAEPVMDATAATAAEFIYSRLVARYGCVESIQSDNGPHFVNRVIKNLVETLGVRHRLSMPYYPQSNGKVERTIGTLKAMLKRTMAVASVAQGQDRKEEDSDIKVFGVELSLNNKILEAIVDGEERRRASVVNELEERVSTDPAVVH